MSAEPASPCGRAGSLAVLTLAVAGLVLRPTLASLLDAWRDVHDYEHGYLVGVIAIAWLAHVARRHWRDPARPSAWGAALLAVVLLAWLIGVNANSQAVHQVLLPVVLWGALLATVGGRLARAAIAPIAFLYFAVPVWEYLLPALQHMSIAATTWLLALLAVPAHIEAYSVTIPDGTFQIIEGCSGKRYLVITAAVAVLAGAACRLRPARFAVLLATACVLALVANWIRIAIIIYAGHVTHMQHHLVAVEHITFGNAVFAVLVVCVTLLARRLSRPEVREQPSERSSTPPEANLPPAADAARSPRWAAVPLGLLVATLVTNQVRASARPEGHAMKDLPGATAPWAGPLAPGDAWMPDYQGADDHRRGAYSSPAGTVEVYANRYAAQRQGSELILYRNTLLAPGKWERPWPPTTVLVESGATSLATFEARAGRESWLIAYVYEIGGWATTSESLAQLAYGVRSFLGPVPSGVIALASRCETDCEAARARVGAFWGDMSARILTAIPDQ